MTLASTLNTELTVPAAVALYLYAAATGISHSPDPLWTEPQFTLL